MSDRIAEIRARLDAVTPGPWELSDHIDCCWEAYVFSTADDEAVPVCYVHNKDGRPNARFLVKAPADIAWLLDEVERLRRYTHHAHNDCWQSGKCVCGLDAAEASRGES